MTLLKLAAVAALSALVLWHSPDRAWPGVLLAWALVAVDLGWRRRRRRRHRAEHKATLRHLARLRRQGGRG